MSGWFCEPTSCKRPLDFAGRGRYENAMKALLLLLCSFLLQAAEPRVLFLGDSITFDGRWTTGGGGTAGRVRPDLSLSSESADLIRSSSQVPRPPK
jgi:hypothetical protein